MRLLRRLLLLAALWWLALMLLRRSDEEDAGVPEWPPFVDPDLPSGMLVRGEWSPPATGNLAGVQPLVAGGARSSGPRWAAPIDGQCPDGYPLKVAESGIIHVPGGRSYERTRPVRCYAKIEDAEADGYRQAKR